MTRNGAIQDRLVRAGYVCAPSRPTRLCAVAASGMVVTLFDPRLGRGGMCHYLEPRRRNGLSTPAFAAPALVALVEMLDRAGARRDGLEAHLYGGATNPASPRHVEGLAGENERVGVEVLDKMGVAVTGRDTGGGRGRKIVFNSATGETLVARVERLRDSDWYPSLDPTGMVEDGRRRGL